MSASAKPLPKKDLLEKLTVDELREGIDRWEISVRDRRIKAVLVEALDDRTWEEIRKEILSGLPRDRLKELCRAFDLDDRGQRKADLVARLGQPVLTVFQPWAWAIISGGKGVENRGSSPKFRGRLWIHAGQDPDDEDQVDEMCGLAAQEKGVEPARIRARYERERAFGKVIGSVELVKVVTKSASRWRNDTKYGLVLRKPDRLREPIDLKGSQGIFYAAGLPPLP